MADEHSNRYYNVQVDRMKTFQRRTAESLRDLADVVERQEPSPELGNPHGPNNYTRHASRIIHDIHWAFANLNLAHLVDIAADIEIARQIAQET